MSEHVQDRWLHAVSLRDRWRNWREERAEQREVEQEEELEPVSIEQQPRRSILSFFRPKHQEVDPLDDIPAYQRAAILPNEEQVPITDRVPSVWERAEAAVPAAMHAAPIPRASAVAAAAPFGCGISCLGDSRSGTSRGKPRTTAATPR